MRIFDDSMRIFEGIKKCQGFPFTTKLVSEKKFSTLRNEFPFRKMKGFDLPTVAPEGKTKTSGRSS